MLQRIPPTGPAEPAPVNARHTLRASSVPPPATWPPRLFPAPPASAWRNDPQCDDETNPPTLPRHVVAAYLDAEAFVRATYRNAAHDGLLVPTLARLEPGLAVMVDLRFSSGVVPSFVLRGRVGFVADGPWGTAAGVDLAGNEAAARARLLGLLAGAGAVRQTPRIAVHLPVELRARELGALHAVALDLGAEGLFVRTRAPLAVGTLFRVRLFTARVGPVEVEAVVVNRRAGRSSGVGARFLPQSAAEVQQLADVMTALSVVNPNADRACPTWPARAA